MTDSNFVQMVALKAGLTNEEAERLISGFVEIIQNEVKESKKLEINGFGVFELLNNELNFTADKDLLN